MNVTEPNLRTPPVDCHTTEVPPSAKQYDLLVKLFVALRTRVIFLSLFTLIVTAAAAGMVFAIPFVYSAEATIMTPQQTQSSVSALASGALGAAGGFASQLGLKTQTDLYAGLLKSRTITDEIIVRFGLCQIYKKVLLSDARKILNRRTTIETGKDSLIHISVDDHEPERAARLANAYVEELYKQNARLALTEASQRRLFFAQQISAAREALNIAERGLKNSQESSGLMMPSGQAEALIASAAQLRAQLRFKQIELDTTRSFATDQNPRVAILEREVQTLENQVRSLEATGGGLLVPASRLPSAGLDYARKLREVKAHETILEFLGRQYEAAFLDEAKSAPLIQIVDPAVPPDRKSWPPRLSLILGSAVAAFFVATILVLFQGSDPRERA